MNHMTVYLKNKILSEKLQNVFVGLFNEENEISAQVMQGNQQYLQPKEGQTSNKADILFPIAKKTGTNNPLEYLM